MEYLEPSEKDRLGSFELKRQVGPNLLKGLLVSCLIHGSVVASPLIFQLLWGEEVVVEANPASGGNDTLIVVLPPLEHQDPRRWDPMLEPPLPTRPKVVVPQPVDVEPPDTVEQLPSVEDLRRFQDYKADSLNRLAGDGGGGPMAYIEPPDDPIVPPDSFVAVEIQPQPLATNPQPLFPDLARTSGVGGTVVVKMYVDRKGRVKDWLIMKTDPPGLGFEEEVLEILPKWKFTPAIQSGKPVGVWVAVPFRFRVDK